MKKKYLVLLAGLITQHVHAQCIIDHEYTTEGVREVTETHIKKKDCKPNPFPPGYDANGNHDGLSAIPCEDQWISVTTTKKVSSTEHVEFTDKQKEYLQRELGYYVIEPNKIPTLRLSESRGSLFSRYTLNFRYGSVSKNIWEKKLRNRKENNKVVIADSNKGIRRLIKYYERRIRTNNNPRMLPALIDKLAFYKSQYSYNLDLKPESVSSIDRAIRELPNCNHF